MSRRTGRLTAFLIAGALLVLLVAFGPTLWRKGQFLYYRIALENDPEYLATIIDAPEGSAKYRAIIEYLDSPEGEVSFLTLLLEEGGRQAITMYSRPNVLEINTTGQLCIRKGDSSDWPTPRLQTTPRFLDRLVGKEVSNSKAGLSVKFFLAVAIGWRAL